jgi:hypothetical protein
MTARTTRWLTWRNHFLSGLFVGQPSSTDHAARQVVQDLLVASAAIPGAFPPMMIMAI